MSAGDDRDTLDGLDDALLVERIVAGDEGALMAAYDRHGDTLFGIAVRFLADREAAAEIVQETFMSLWQRADRYDAEAGSLLAWLIGITRHRALDRIRADSRRPRIVASVDAAGRTGAEDDAGGWSIDPSAHGHGDDPADEVGRRWSRSVVRSALAEMPEAERHVLVLAYDHGLSQSEIAGRLGWPIGTVKSRTRRALATLRERLVAIPELTGS